MHKSVIHLHTTSKSQLAIKAPTFSLCFSPFPFSAQSVALMHFLTNRPHTFSFQNILSNLIFSSSALLNHSSSYCGSRSITTCDVQCNLSGNIFSVLAATVRSFANFKIICAQSESFICHPYAYCGSNFAQLICCSSSITIPNGPAVSFRFNLHIRSLAINGIGQVSEHKNACFNALPPSVSHFNGTV